MPLSWYRAAMRFRCKFGPATLGLVALLALGACKRPAPTPDPAATPPSAALPSAAVLPPKPTDAPVPTAVVTPSASASSAPTLQAEDADALAAKIKAAPSAWNGKTVRARGRYRDVEGFAGTPMVHFQGLSGKGEYTCVGKQGSDVGDFKDNATIVVEGKVLQGALFLNPCTILSR